VRLQIEDGVFLHLVAADVVLFKHYLAEFLAVPLRTHHGVGHHDGNAVRLQE